VRVSDTSNYIDEVYRVRVNSLLEGVSREFQEECPVLLKIRAYYVKNQATDLLPALATLRTLAL